ncbi:MAG: 23S rRNA (uracil(1939)-C(5))-methyltransferase RlmD [Elusimicrobiota bacterium]
MKPPPVRVRIERITPEGQGMGRPEGGGPVHFVRYSAPGDVLDVAVERVRSGYAQARLLEVRRPGPGRVEPRCPLHYKPPCPSATCGKISSDPHCGGCDWQHLAPEAQLEAKREIVRDCLFRIAKLREPHVLETLPSPARWRYRNKVQVPFGMARGTGGASRIVAGFYAPGTHRIADFADCLVQPELSVRLTLKVKELARGFGWRIYDENRNAGWLRHLFVRTNRKGQALAALVTRTPDFPKREEFVSAVRRAFPEIVGLFQNVQPLATPVVLGPRWRKLWGRDHIEERVGRLRLLVSPSAFLQVNTPACETLYGVVSEFLYGDGFRPRVVLDLYCGSGAIALWIAPGSERVLGVEENREAVSDAWANARLNGARNVRFQAGGVETALGRIRKELSAAPGGSAAAVLDPPRAGCSKVALKGLRDPALARTVYVSCNPATFARDADWLSRHGWRLTRVQPVDLFPQTSHVELVGLFERSRRPTT